MKLANAHKKRRCETFCMDGPSNLYAKAASVRAIPNKRATSPRIIRTDIEIQLRPVDRMAMMTRVKDARRFKPMMTRNAGTALSGVAPRKVSVCTGGITPNATIIATATKRMAQTNRNHRQKRRLSLMISFQRDPTYWRLPAWPTAED